MRALFSLVGLLVVVGIVAMLSKRQLQAVAPAPLPSGGGAASAAAESPRQMQQRALQDLQRALDQAAQQRASAPE